MLSRIHYLDFRRTLSCISVLELSREEVSLKARFYPLNVGKLNTQNVSLYSINTSGDVTRA
jgi:hypothetical protein